MSLSKQRILDLTKAHLTARRLALGLVVGSGLVIAGCSGGGFQPLYGVSATGEQVRDELRHVQIATIPGRVGQRIRNELIFRTTGGGYADDPKYELRIAIRESVRSILVQVDGDARGRVYELRASYKIVDLSNNKVLTEGQGTARASYQHFKTIFSNVRAKIDAENRAADEIAKSIRVRVAAFLSAGPRPTAT